MPPPLTPLQAKELLIKLGFRFLQNVKPDKLGLQLDLATREFQRYAKMPQVAFDPGTGNPVYSERLRQEVNSNPLGVDVQIDGRYNEPETRARLDLWRGSGYLCPVVISSWMVNGDQRVKCDRENDNIWLPQQATRPKNRVYVRDFSGMPNTTSAFVRLGRFEGVGPTRLSGNLGEAVDRVSYEELTKGSPLSGELEIRRQRTFRVVGAVAYAETGGLFTLKNETWPTYDAINARDNAVVSMGFCHWTLGLLDEKKQRAPGELGGLLSYLKSRPHETAFQMTLGRWGLDVHKNWAQLGAAPGGHATYESSLQDWHWTDGAHEPRPITGREQSEFLRSWHWFYRWVLAVRFSRDLQLGFWHMARLRLRDLLEVPWPLAGEARTGDVIPQVEIDGKRRPAKLGEVFRSERCRALLLRWHVKFPSHVVNRIFRKEGSKKKPVMVVAPTARMFLNRACTVQRDKSGKPLPFIPADQLVKHDWSPAYQKLLANAITAQAVAVGFDGDLKKIDKFRAIGLTPDTLDHQINFEPYYMGIDL